MKPKTQAEQILFLQETIQKQDLTNKMLQQSVNTLMRQVGLLERKLNVTANSARNSEHKLTQIGTTLTLTEQKVSRVENILRRY